MRGAGGTDRACPPGRTRRPPHRSTAPSPRGGRRRPKPSRPLHPGPSARPSRPSWRPPPRPWLWPSRPAWSPGRPRRGSTRRVRCRVPAPRLHPSTPSCARPHLLLALALALLLGLDAPALFLAEEAERRRRARRVDEHAFVGHARVLDADLAHVDDAVELAHAVEELRELVIGAAHVHLDGDVGVEVGVRLVLLAK